MGPNDQPMDDVFKEAIKRLENRFAKETNLVLATYKFDTQPQDHHESIDDFVSRLRELSVKCRFGTMTDELIRDQLIVQCCDKKILERLWAAKDPTLQESIDLAKVMEESRRCIKELETKEKTVDVMALSSDSTESQQETGNVPKKVGYTRSKGKESYRCGSTFHLEDSKKCFAANKECRKCGHRGNYDQVCRESN
ncbi:hypothetical protein NDU88_004361 [Pleurodeles waltl]|uniref:CCHC-type domain-containing protein n=1 Tax=Pleurodeles waltl TaxID=8319 RepID=A0AAV7T8J7_PLEWA|nr:hypothetical protein NDU88_004361 [Pleurodeles waltl]